MAPLAFFELKVARRGQAPHHFPLFIIQLAPRSQAASATWALIVGIHNSPNGHYRVVRLTDFLHAYGQIVLKLISCFVTQPSRDISERRGFA
jgi:hypothetical protein